MRKRAGTLPFVRRKPSPRRPKSIAVDPVRSAAAARLRYVSDKASGIKRVMGSLGFRYIGPSGKVVRRPSDLKRIRALAIPPAWTDVWICSDPRGHLQATGRDARGRKQYRYHADWRRSRDETKYERMLDFAAALPKIRARTKADLAKPGLPREKVIATVVQLLEKSLIRVGNEEYARHNRSFGLTTLRNKHVAVKGSTLRFQFRGKSGVRHVVDVNDPRLARIVRQCRDLPGQELFQYIDDGNRRQSIDSSDVNGYLKAITGDDFTAKDFRTWLGTVLACTALRELKDVRTATETKRNVVHAIEAVAGILGNTRAVCRKSYIHPAILDAYSNGALREAARRCANGARKPGGRLSPDEAVVVALLRQRTGSKAA